MIKARLKPLQEKIEDQRARITTQCREADKKNADIKKLQRDMSATSAKLNSAELDLRLATKDLKLKGERLVELTRKEAE